MLKIFIPADTTACALGADKVAAEVVLQAQNRGLDVEVKRIGSRGAFWLEPLLEIESGEDRYAFGPVNSGDVAGLFEAGLHESSAHPLFLGKVTEIEWLARQERLTFGRAGVIDPLSLDDYKHEGGYEGLNRALAMTADEIVGGDRLRLAWTGRGRFSDRD